MAGKPRGRAKGTGTNENLTPFNKMDPKKKKEIQSKGGKASAIAYRKRKAFKEDLLEALSVIQENGLSVQDEGVASLLTKFRAGDLKAFEIVRDTVGEKPTEVHDVKVVETDWFK